MSRIAVTPIGTDGESTPEKLLLKGITPLLVSAKGHGTRQRARPDKYGFPKAHAPRAKQ
jgi:hypothetical protein